MKVASGDTATEHPCSSCGGWVELCDECAVATTPSRKSRIRRVTHPKGRGLQIVGTKKPPLPKARPQP